MTTQPSPNIRNQLPLRKRGLGTRNSPRLPLAGCALLLGTLTGLHAAPFDFTFYHVSDTHYRTTDQVYEVGESAGAGDLPHQAKTRANIDRMMALQGTAFFGNNGIVGNPLGVIVSGDLIDGNTESGGTPATQWQNFVADFGLLGNESGTRVKIPVYEGYGNHDQDGYFPQITQKIAERNATRPNVTAVSGIYQYPPNKYNGVAVSGVNYAWKWGPAHFIESNVRVGSGPERYPASGSYQFLKSYLEGTVGNSGDPVFVIFHLNPAASQEDWPTADKQEFYDLIKNYNIAGLILGHTHTYGLYTWSGPNNDGPKAIQVYQADSMYKTGPTQGYLDAFRMFSTTEDPNNATLIMGQRLINGTWGGTSVRTIPLGTGTGPVPVLHVQEWRSLNNHSGTPQALVIPVQGLIEPRMAGVRRIEIAFSEGIRISDPASAVTLTGVNAAGPLDLGSLGINAAAAAATGNVLALTFSDGSGARALPDASKWRLTINPAVVTGVDDAVLTASAETTRNIGALAGDVTADGKVTGIDLNRIKTAGAFNASSGASLRADVTGDAQINSADSDAAWGNRASNIDRLQFP